MLRTCKYRLYPTKDQIVKLEATLDTCRHLYNNSLAERKNQSIFFMLPVEKHWLTYRIQQNELPVKKKEEKEIGKKKK